MKVNDKKLKVFKQNLKKLMKLKIRIGAVGNHSGGISNSELAVIHEFGSETLPDRPPARAPVRKALRDQENLNQYKNILKKSNVMQNEFDVQKVGAQLGSLMVSNIQEQILNGLAPKLKESTQTQKSKLGFSPLALFRTGEFLKSFTHEVVT